MTETAPPASLPNDGPIVARASRSYRVKWLVMGVVLLGGSGWFVYDGFVGYEASNEKARQEAIDAGKAAPEKLHSETDIRLQRIIGAGLIPAGLFVLFWAMYSSRGEYRLAGDILHVPGHPPVPMNAIRAIDQTQWDRKGIARIDYDVNGSTGRLKLDDYIYERGPTDKIHEHILAAVAPAEAAAEAGNESAKG